MNFSALLKGPSQSYYRSRKPNTILVGVFNRNYRPVQHVEITYTPIELGRTHLFPWARKLDTHSRVWHMRTVVYLKDGRTIEKVVVQQGVNDLERVLEIVKLEGVQHALRVLASEKAPSRSQTG